MADIESSTISETASNNTAAPPDGAPANHARTAVKNIFRETLAAVKRFRNRITPTVTSAGTEPAFTLTYTTSPGAYVQGHMFAFKAHATPSGSVTLNVNTLGAKKVYDFYGNAQLGSAAWPANARVIVSYDTALDGGSGGFVWLNQGYSTAPSAASESTSGIAELATQTETNTGTDDARIVTPLKLKSVAADFFSGSQVAIASDSARGTIEVADQTEMEAGSSTTLAVTPGRQNLHPSAAKAWVKFNGTGTVAINSSYNTTSITDNGTGDYTWNIATDFSSTHWALAGMCWITTTNTGALCRKNGSAMAAGAVNLTTFNIAGSGLADADEVYAVGYGDQ